MLIGSEKISLVLLAILFPRMLPCSNDQPLEYRVGDAFGTMQPVASCLQASSQALVDCIVL